MRITKKQLKRIIREAFLNERMLNIIANKHSPETATYNRIANYALKNDLDAAMSDSEVNNADLYYTLDGMRPWVRRVGKSDWMSPGTVVPSNWDPKMVYDFMDDLENAWHNQGAQDDLQVHQSSPDVKERETIGAAFSLEYFLPEDISNITYQPRKRAGKISRIDLETANDVTWVDDRFIGSRGTTLDKILSTLEKGGAKLRKRRKRVKHTPPMYD